MLTQTLPWTWIKVSSFLAVAKCAAFINTSTSVTPPQNLPIAFINQLLQPLPPHCHVILQGSHGGDILEMLEESQRPLQPLDGLNLDSGMISLLFFTTAMFPHTVATYAAEHLNKHLKMNAQCSLYIARYAKFTQNHANLIGLIFRRIESEQIFIIDESSSDKPLRAAVEYNLIKKIPDHGMLPVKHEFYCMKLLTKYLDTIIITTICPNGPIVGETVVWTKERGLKVANTIKCHGVLQGTVQDFAIFGLPPHVIWG